ncbi:MAG: hypothetical protein WB662_01295, partial [Methyloceanibacter sp.]
IQVRLSDKVTPVLPPYSSEEQQAVLAEEREWERSGTGPWDRKELLGHVCAGGGTALMVKKYLQLARLHAKTKRSAILAGRYYDAGASIMYVVSGRKCF